MAGDSQMVLHQHQLVKEKGVLGIADVEDPLHRHVNELQIALVYMVKTVPALMSEKCHYLQKKRELLSRNTLLALVAQRHNHNQFHRAQLGHHRASFFDHKDGSVVNRGNDNYQQHNRQPSKTEC